jgi:hypothetical protein
MKCLWRLFSIFLVGLLFGANRTQAAEIYCRSSSTRVWDGSEAQVNWDVVNSSARRVQLPGQSKPTTGCSFSWRSVGAMYRPPEIIEAPKLGSARAVSNYRIFYQSARNGQDRLTARIHWINASTGKLQSAIVRYNIVVIDRPL